MLRKSVFILLIFYFINTQAQNIHDLEHSKQFANYLFKTQQYSLAAEEYERINFLEPENIQNKYLLITSYRKAKEYQQALKRFYVLFDNNLSNIPSNFAEEYVKLLLHTNQYNLALNYLSINDSLNINLKQNINI